MAIRVRLSQLNLNIHFDLADEAQLHPGGTPTLARHAFVLARVQVRGFQSVEYEP